MPPPVAKIRRQAILFCFVFDLSHGFVLSQNFEGHMAILSSSPLKEIREKKWKGIKPRYWAWFAWYLFFLLIFTVDIAVRPPVWNFAYAPTPALAVLEILITIHYVVSVVFEVWDFVAMWRKKCLWGTMSFFSLLIYLSDISFWLAFIFRFLGDRVIYFASHSFFF